MPGYDEQNKQANIRIQELAELACKRKTTKREENELANLITPKLQYYIWKFFQSRPEPAEHTSQALQETLTKAFDKIESYDPKLGRFTTWIFNIARNTTLLYDHNEFKKLQTVDIDPLYYKVSDSVEDDYQDVLDHEKEVQSLYKMAIDEIMNLPDLDKKGKKNIEKIILVESIVNRLKGDEISTKYNINPNTVKTKKRKAKRILKQRLLEKGDDFSERLKDAFDIDIDAKAKKKKKVLKHA